MNEEYRIFFNTADSGEKAVKPELPVILALNGLIYEATSLKGAVAVIVKEAVNEDYLDAGSTETEWHLRVQAARSHVMLAAMTDREAVVWSSSYGRIMENYSAGEDDPDYEDDFTGEPEKIIVDDDLAFVKSLAGLGTVGVWVRDGYDLEAGAKDSGAKEEGGRYTSISDGQGLIF